MKRKFLRRLSYNHYFLKNLPSSLAIRWWRKPKQTNHFNGVKNINIEMTNEALKKVISSGKPFCAIRFGAVELSCLNAHEKIELGYAHGYKDSVVSSMKLNAGYFPTDQESLKRYGDELLPLLEKTDYLGISGAHMEDYFQKYYCPKAKIVLYEGMEPLHGDWTSTLEGKKVLVISPFEKEIHDQYQKRELLFPKDSHVLPEFTLLTIKAPMTLGDEDPQGTTFFEELSKMEKEMDGTDFDLALIGAGAYGSFLAIHAKELGKQGIQTGGATATLFGILGKRWEKREHVARYVNENWIRPYEKPLGYEKIERGAYW